MTSEEALEHLQFFSKNILKGTDPVFAEAIKKAIEVLIIDASKQKIRQKGELIKK